jgi:hypothetical protein
MQLVRISISYTFTLVAKFSSSLEKFNYPQCKSCQPQCKNPDLAINVQFRKTHLICRDIDPALVERQEGNT